MKEDRETEFERLFKDNYSAMFSTAFAILHDVEESKDMVSEVFAALWNGSVSVRSRSERGFLVTCVRNRCMNIVAHRSLDEKLSKLYPIEMELSMDDNEERERRWQQIQECIRTKLTPQTARVIDLCFCQRKKYAEAAAMLGISVAAVNKHVTQGLRKLRKELSK